MAKALVVYSSGGSTPSGSFLNVSGAAAGNATEMNVVYAITHDCVLSNLSRAITAGGSGTNTITLRKNSADVTGVASGAGTGVATDTTHTDSFVSGDLVSVAVLDTGTDATYRSITANVEFDTGHGSFTRACATSPRIFDVESATQFMPISGLLANDGVTTEADVQWKVRGYTSVDAFQINVTANARANDTTVVLRVNGADVAASEITVGAGMTGIFMVTDINQALAAGDLVCAAITLGAGVEDITIAHTGATFLSSSNASELWAHQITTRAASATPSYFVIGGGINDLTSITNMAITPGFAADCTNLRLYLSANTYSADATCKLFVNGVAALTLTIPAATTGWLENTSDTVTIDANDAIAIEIDDGTSGSITLTSLGLTLATPSEVDPSVVTTRSRLSGVGLGIGSRGRNHPWPAFSRIDHD